jgi:hypothetical protein
MLQRDTHTTERQSRGTGETRRRSIDAILARREARLKERKKQFAPDFLHGRTSLDVGYTELGETWMENTIFVEHVRDDGGEVQAWTVGWFQDRFLTIEQCVRGETEDFEAKLARRLNSRRSVVRLELDGYVQHESGGEIAFDTSMARFIALEREQLGVIRDTDITDRARVRECRDAVMADSETTMMSLVCLCAVLAR